MHLTPEQIDRQPFRMTRRGYDIVQVRNFLREIASEMRARQDVRERLAADGAAGAVAENEAHAIITAAREEADAILAEAAERAGSVDKLEAADATAEQRIRDAEAEVETLVDDAERRARERADAVLHEAQVRLDRLLEQEREVHARIESARVELDEAIESPSDPDEIVVTELVPDSSLADFMKSTLRHEVRPD